MDKKYIIKNNINIHFKGFFNGIALRNDLKKEKNLYFADQTYSFIKQIYIKFSSSYIYGNAMLPITRLRASHVSL